MTINDVMTFKEASENWNKKDNTLRMMVRTNKLSEGVDYRKSGNTWIITREAMEKLYGEEKNN